MGIQIAPYDVEKVAQPFLKVLSKVISNIYGRQDVSENLFREGTH